jgi:acetolactate synthase-1/2/3 large subunit
VAEALGGKGVLLKDAAQTASCLEEARIAASQGVPVLVNVWLDRTDFRDGSLSM